MPNPLSKHPNHASTVSLTSLITITAVFISGSILTGIATAESVDTKRHNITDIIFTTRAASCADFASASFSNVSDIQNRTEHDGSILITTDGEQCEITSNAIPNHDFNGTGNFRHRIKAQDQHYTITAKPSVASKPTDLSLTFDNAIFLNGVKLDLLAAGCYGIRNGKTGCNNMNTSYRYDPLNSAGGFGTDEHNAHTQPNGAYHYHGNPMAMFIQSNTTDASPVIGFAADGFPIFGSYINDNGEVRKAVSGYELKNGTRAGGPKDGDGNYEQYDGTFIDDYEYTGTGDLDECNGMYQDGVYGYVVTESYPHIMGCFTGTPDRSFSKR